MPYTEIRRPYVNGQPVGVVEAEAGGSNRSSMAQWVIDNQIVTEGMLEHPSGPVQANSRGKLDPSKLGIALPPPTVSGKRTVASGSQNTWTITNYSSFSQYVVQVTGAASFTVDKDTIQITAGSAGVMNLIINGRQHAITVQ